MPLLDRVAVLIQANISDLVDRAEDPEKLLQQLLLDMQNQYLQVKTDLAAALSTQRLSQQGERENRHLQAQWLAKAERAAGKNQSSARKALERALAYQGTARAFANQNVQQSVQIQLLRTALQDLESKMSETRVQMHLARVARRSPTQTTPQPGPPPTRTRDLPQPIELLLQDLKEKSRNF